MKGSISDEALAEYSRLAAEKLDLDFAEGEVYDFGRCMRADGSFYGTSGKCRKGSEAGAKEKAERAEMLAKLPKNTATPGNAARAKAAREKLKAEKKANGGKRTDRIQEERRLAQNRAQRERDAKVKANQKKQAEMG
jgi:hypothetical protein